MRVVCPRRHRPHGRARQHDFHFHVRGVNGPEMFEPYDGFSGPWRGTYFTAMEGSLRVPLLMRWPGHIPPGTISNEIIHEMD